ncbi:aldo/keto reductase [Vagococcus allomyrinae]|uniref:aldo/keto reductase n=1 Tax=Vagococcus allomyrinae TaxID=2794353 RepID=UPI003221947B
MKTIKIGKSDVRASVIGLGTNAVGGHNLYPDLDEAEGKDLVRSALDSGISLIDTAFAYGRGRSEELVGQVLQEYPREQVVIATKASHLPEGTGHSNSLSFMEKALAASLKRLQTDYIDIFYIHFPDEITPKNQVVALLNDYKQQGIIRAIGVSNFSLAQLKEANQDGYVDVVQDEYNLIARQNEQTLMAYCQEQQLSYIPFFPLASGLLTGKYQADVVFPATDFRSRQANFQGERYRQTVAKVKELQPLADKYHVAITHVVLNWYLQRRDISAIIPGAKNARQVADNLQAISFKLTPQEVEFIDGLFS